MPADPSQAWLSASSGSLLSKHVARRIQQSWVLLALTGPPAVAILGRVHTGRTQPDGFRLSSDVDRGLLWVWP